MKRHLEFMTNKFFPLVVVLCVMAGSVPAQDDLAKSFTTPPDSARPWVYWFPLSGNLTKEGITADFEAMARVGIGGALYMEVDQGAPKGKADFAGPLWRELIQHACREAERLGLEINMNNDAGWCGSGGPWITPEYSMQRVVWSETLVIGGNRFEAVLEKPEGKRNFYRDIAVVAVPATFKELPADSIIRRDRMVDLTTHMDKDGRLGWDVPPGKWLILRFGHTTTGVENSPAPESGRGLECDKFSKEAAGIHYRHLMGKVVADNQRLSGQGKALVATHIDSWEVGLQNWTSKMTEEFQQRRGYSLLPFLPVFTGRVVDSVEVKERFLWDLRQTISDLIIENYAGEMRGLANKDGLRLSIEAYVGPVSSIDYGGQADEPMSEFWERMHRSLSWMSSSAHTYGRRILAAEAFTALDKEAWLQHPGMIKALADVSFCHGVNRLVFHRYAAQPWTNRVPGMAMGPWGMHYERTQSWWEQSKPWHTYLARCQSLLREGVFVADIAYLADEGVPNNFVPQEWKNRGGYNFDTCTPKVLLSRMSVKDGRLVLPDGMSYRVLVLPDVETMTPRLLRKIKELSDAGALIIGGSRPPQKSPSLADYGAGDAGVKRLADELWPKLITGKSAAEVLAAKGVPPDFSATDISEGIRLRYVHRKCEDTEIYFVANELPRTVESLATFRVAGKRPEIWDPETGSIHLLDSFKECNGVTTLPLRLGPSASAFVIFRASSKGVDPIVQIARDGKALAQGAFRKADIVIKRADYGVLGDPNRTADMTRYIQEMVARGQTDINLMCVPGDPAPNRPKRMEVDYLLNGRVMHASAQRVWVEFGCIAALDPERADAPLDLGRGEAWQSGHYVLTRASGASREITVALPPPQEIPGSWDVSFDPRWGGPEQVVFDKLEDWSKRPEDGVKYYSGTAVYRKLFKFPSETRSRNSDSRIYLDLGAVEIMASIKLNGKEMGILWKPPYRIDVTDELKSGDNQLEIRVTNLLINRMIGDEQLPEDCDRNDNGTLKCWPKWIEEGKPSPTGRYTFGSWKLWKKGDSLVTSGLFGPVKLITTRKIEIK